MSCRRARIDIADLLVDDDTRSSRKYLKRTHSLSNPWRTSQDYGESFCTAPEHSNLPYLPPEILMLIVAHMPYEDRVPLTRVNRQWRLLALDASSKLKIMRDLPICAPAPSSITAPEWLHFRSMTPASRMLMFQRVVASMSSQLTYLNLLGTNLLSQDLMSWIYDIDLPELQIIKMPNGTDLYLALLRELALRPDKWPKLTYMSVGFGSKLEIPEEAPELINHMRRTRRDLRSNISRCTHCARLFYVDSRVKCACCDRHICSQHFTRTSGNHCFLSRRIKCPYSMLKYHTVCATLHHQRGCAGLDLWGQHFACYKPHPSDAGSASTVTSDEEADDTIEN